MKHTKSCGRPKAVNFIAVIPVPKVAPKNIIKKEKQNKTQSLLKRILIKYVTEAKINIL